VHSRNYRDDGLGVLLLRDEGIAGMVEG
jgi:hypothetical protein